MTIDLDLNRSAHQLARELGLVLFARATLSTSDKYPVHFVPEILDKKFAAQTEAIYAWSIGDRIVRIGDSLNSLGTRQVEACRWWSRAASGINRSKSPAKQASDREHAAKWRDAIEVHGSAFCYGRAGTPVKTPMGWISSYRSEERFLLQALRPPLNNSHRQKDKQRDRPAGRR